MFINHLSKKLPICCSGTGINKKYASSNGTDIQTLILFFG